MKHSIATESYIEGVVEYKQYKDALGLTAPEARHHPDTLEVFEELTENVATNDGLRFIYTSALRSRGENRQNAIAAVREVESEIIILLHDLDIIGNTAYRNTLAKLEDNAEIKKRAERFIQLFKPVFPVSELPKARKRKVSRKAPETSDDSQPTLADHEPSTPVTDSSSAVIQSPEIRQFIPFYDRVRMESSQKELSAQTDLDNQRAEIRQQGAIIRFSNHLLSSIIKKEVIDESGVPGVVWTALSRSIASELGIEIEDAKQAVRNLLHSGDLTVVGHVSGIRRLSGQHSANADHNDRAYEDTVSFQEREISEQPVFTVDELAQAKRILELLGSDKHIERGVKVKSLWQDNEDDEVLIRETISKLIKYGDSLVMRSVPKRARRNSEPFIRFTNHAAFRRYKEDPDLVVKFLQTLLDE